MAKKEEFERVMAQGAIDAIVAWMNPVEPKFYSQGYLLMFMQLIVQPGLKRSELALFLENTAKISRSTADRFITEAGKAGHIVIENPAEKPGLKIYLNDRLREHFSRVFKVSQQRAEERTVQFK